MSDEGSDVDFFDGLDSADPVLIDTRLTPLPTTPRCVTPAAPLVWAVETVGESKSPSLCAVPIREELKTAEVELFSSPLALADAIPRISERIDFGFKATCCKSSSCSYEECTINSWRLIYGFLGVLIEIQIGLAFFSRSPQRPESVSISASLSVRSLSFWNSLEDCWMPSSNSAGADDVADSPKLFTSFKSRCTRDLQTDMALWQYGIAS